MDSLFGFIGNSEEKYRKKLEKMSDREFMDEYYKYSRTEKKGGALFSEMNRRRTEGGHSEEIIFRYFNCKKFIFIFYRKYYAFSSFNVSSF